MFCTRNAVTYEEENDSAEEHQALDCGLIEGVVHRVRMLVVAVLTDPRLGQRRAVPSGASVANALKL